MFRLLRQRLPDRHHLRHECGNHRMQALHLLYGIGQRRLQIGSSRSDARLSRLRRSLCSTPRPGSKPITVGEHRVDFENPNCIENVESVAESVLRESTATFLSQANFASDRGRSAVPPEWRCTKIVQIGQFRSSYHHTQTRCDRRRKGGNTASGGGPFFLCVYAYPSVTRVTSLLSLASPSLLAVRFLRNPSAPQPHQPPLCCYNATGGWRQA
jgi:hypothetical protein